MSLESKIDTLTAAIQMLTNVIANHPSNFTSTTTITEQVEEVVAEVAEQAEKKTTKKTTKAKANAKVEEKVVEEKDTTPKTSEVSADDLKAACLKAARSAPDAKAKVKALLKEFGATIVKDVANHDRATVLARLNTGEY